MSLIERLDSDMKEALRARDKVRLETIRGIRGAIRNKEIELGKTLDADGVVRVIRGLAKQRAVADKQFFDLVMTRRIAHRNDPTLNEHVQNAAAKMIGQGTGDERNLRFVKKSEALKIDALVAASMAAYQALRLNL